MAQIYHDLLIDILSPLLTNVAQYTFYDIKLMNYAC